MFISPDAVIPFRGYKQGQIINADKGLCTNKVESQI